MKRLFLIVLILFLNPTFIACTDNEEILEKENIEENTTLTLECCGEDKEIILPPPLSKNNKTI